MLSPSSCCVRRTSPRSAERRVNRSLLNLAPSRSLTRSRSLAPLSLSHTHSSRFTPTHDGHRHTSDADDRRHSSGRVHRLSGVSHDSFDDAESAAQVQQLLRTMHVRQRGEREGGDTREAEERKEAHAGSTHARPREARLLTSLCFSALPSLLLSPPLASAPSLASLRCVPCIDGRFKSAKTWVCSLCGDHLKKSSWDVVPLEEQRFKTEVHNRIEANRV